jgi:hypothetical protein
MGVESEIYMGERLKLQFSRSFFLFSVLNLKSFLFYKGVFNNYCLWLIIFSGFEISPKICYCKRLEYIY